MSAPPVPDAPTPFDASWRQEVGAGLDADGMALIDQAVAWAEPRFEGQHALTGEPLAGHGAGVVRILAALHTDAATRAAALLAALPTDLMAPAPSLRNDPVAAAFGAEIARLVQGARALLRLGVVARQASDAAAESGSQKEMQRKMLLAMAADLRIVLMRLASRLRTLRWHAESKAPCSTDFARETLDLYAPLANRLGIWQIKWEMEDLAFRFLEPEKYKQIARLLEEKRVEREAFIAGAIERLQTGLARAGVEAEVSGRPKHIYSIWNKMRVKRLDFSQMYDLRALRIIVDDVRACYTALGMVHEMWTPISEEFDDYISRPKPNGYRSLHTVVADDDGRPFEVQIRTREMHQFAEYGMAAHWRYKEAGAKGGQVAASSEYDRQLAWMRQLLAWNSDVEGGSEPAKAVPAKPASGKSRGPAAAPPHTDERIYVLTPQARVIELPAGATPVDFAYHLHTDLGHRCRGARVDGQMVPLQTHLSTGQTVEIISAKSGGPSRDWLNPQLGFLASPRARAKVRMWFNAIELQQRITQGQALVEKELQRLGKTAVNLEQLAQNLGFARADDLYVAAAKEEFSLRQIDTLFQQPAPAAEPQPAALRHASAGSAEKSGKSGVLVVGVGSLLTQLARCCRPAPPDPIAGFVTRGRGVSIHRSDCHSYLALAAREPERVIEVAWGETADTFYPVDISVRAHDRSGLLRDLSEVFARLRLNVVGVNTQSKQSLAHMVFTVEVRGGESLSRALDALAEVPGVSSATRR
ncbi:bifunctional (p)ppGpp synthetase/guanosine-3',5'-bis(diphosphate) 3'-pyrophosphohydrolase [Achromobacter insolitus]|uniref:GTP pyrophosphokinase n=2 Tax=Achromobacter insolitus TaxID=217204 RepID=A0A6S7FGG3_9BURK|nr:bifunctional (p)ppGpp synthetase/guanosine-3',5'-bis(diphosphate) 3'-pyrophosphohydrolase [Achromobacter insolitus]AVG43356.1 bifunctional (p)ppGpp synthetase/guanosine-3',5'-bis(diphosphate) 3'-pyrophosphohydrolase [Achromobacter insolitus]AXA72568.1 GTP pyrophosphokinase [Achromobacter insolitus]MDH3066156.1 bifunctional (p)ppGpp synthetase/guanosine-3',5'-bis(diphosphate) 3'-pyrophosphohydrolase [Achromobacter insolitus]NGT13845.1 bifunctional (p)ppGpp synthetase/guanosine-3',5'-bis(dipho